MKQQQINKAFLVCQDKDRAHVNDPGFENWIHSDAMKHVSTDWGDGFETDDSGFTYCNQSPEPNYPPDAPFPFIKPVYARYRCPWEHVTAIYEARGGYGTVYIFTSKEERHATDGDE